MEDKNTTKSEAAAREEKVLEFWRENKIFEKSLEASKGRKEFVFYEGPPTANAKPALHHLAARAFKDVIPRYKTMRGYHVRRKAGWDTHGLPVELQVEKKLGLNSKKAIEEYGIAKFNRECRESVWEYVGVWNQFTERIGYWVDQANPYVTYHNTFIESVWNIVKKVNDQGLFYKDYKVVPWCPRCGTALSSHELAQGYQDDKDLSVYAKFKLFSPAGLANTYILAWTTTPWTLPGNLALAIGKDITYVKAKVGEEIYILAKARLSVLPESYEVLEELTGKDLVGLEYEPLYPYLANTLPDSEKPKLEKAYKVYEADFVTTEDGTGVVHTAVMYGQDDFVLGTKIGLPKHHLVGLDGKFLSGTGQFEARFVKDEEVAVDIIKDLAHRELLFKKEKYEHSYPHCWRCKTALIYYARDSWYIKMSDPKVKDKLISENQEINWEPAHIREGRFGEWLKDIKDWAISRERYWGTPLPVWHCRACKKTEVLGSISDLKEKAKKSGNKYFVMRHGESEKNVKKFTSHKPNDGIKLTEKGREDTRQSLQKFKGGGIDLIVTSELLRARETAEIAREVLGLPAGALIVDSRINEYDHGVFDGCPDSEWTQKFPSAQDIYENGPEGGESVKDLRERIGGVLYEFEEKYQNKNILFVSHGAPAVAFIVAAEGMLKEKAVEAFDHREPKPAEILTLDFAPIPHNEDYELDLHRPYIDEVILLCDCGGELARTREVMDVWFDSGAMPFAQDHYPFENKKWVDGPGYPADYISEAIDQTRGWFYTLHAVGVLMGRGKAYKNVICLGHLLDASGKKMSKSIGNIVDPWEAMEKFGVDALRLWMYSINQPGESKNFDEKTVLELHRQTFGLLYNVLAFYELYRDKSLEQDGRPKSVNILDQWILTRMDELVETMTKHMDSYKLLEPTRAVKDFIGDLSTWYLRRSRERIKDGDKAAKQTLYFVLKNLAKLLAPFAPFAAEDIWLKLRNESDTASVHLEKWPEKPFKLFSFGGSKVIEKMEAVREAVSLGLKERQIRNIPVRQPLAELEVKDLNLTDEYVDLIKDELNVKKVSPGQEFKLITELTEELKQEGDYRELSRALQDMRKKLGLTPSEVIKIGIETSNAGRKLIEKFASDLKKIVLLSEISFYKSENKPVANVPLNAWGVEIKVGDLVFKVTIEKVNG